MKIIFFTILFINIVWANFHFDECSGSGSFEQQIINYKGDYENTVLVDTIPVGIIGLRVELTSDKDVDIRLYGENKDKVVHWPYGILSREYEESTLYKDVNVTYSGYNGVNGEKGHEFIELSAATPTSMMMKAFGYKAGYATVTYSWTGKVGCTPKESGTDSFTQSLEKDSTSLVGTIPKNVKNVHINLTSDKDLDIQLYGEDGTAIVSWKPQGLLSGSMQQSIEYHGMQIIWSGYHGVDAKKGHEYITITPKTTELLTMKVYGYSAGNANVSYTWGEDTDITAPIITLKGSNPQSIELGSSYIELGASTDDGSIIEINTTAVNSNKVGTYIVTYNAKDTSGNKAKTVTRIVKVSDCISWESLKEKIANNEDVTKVNTGCITDMSRLFQGNQTFNQDISEWNVSGVTNMLYMFANATVFDQDISGWDVSNVTNMFGMFSSAENFNQNIEKWNVTNVINMEALFYAAEDFNQPLGEWNVSNVISMGNMFAHATHFNQPLGEWDVSKVINMAGMFNSADNFNQPLGEWNVSNVIDMNAMFSSYHSSFNQPLGKWNVSNVTNMSRMFYYLSRFNQSLKKWDVSKVTSMKSMFYKAYDFNQDITKWNVTNVTDMSYMFRGAKTFNQPLEEWNVSNVMTMKSMFQDANTFNQSIGEWNVSNVIDMENMFSNVTLTTEYYDELLVKWGQLKLQKNVKFSGGNTHYTYIGKPYKFDMINNFSWVITDGGLLGQAKPIAYDRSIKVIQNSHNVSIENIGSDENNEPLTYHIVTSPEHGNIISIAMGLSYTPNFDYIGSDSFTFVVNDGTEDSNVAKITINIIESIQNQDSDGDYIPDQIELFLDLNKNESDSNSNGIADGLDIEGKNSDIFFDDQWHIRSLGKPVFNTCISTIIGNDLNLLNVYHKYMGFNHGNPIIVQVVDTGVDIDHEDLIENIDFSRSYNNLTIGNPSSVNSHGTKVAGIIGARAFNGKGVRGIAPFIKIAATNWLDNQSLEGLEKVWLTGNGANEIAISNNSWGSSYSPSLLYENIISQGCKILRDGKGRIYVKSAGNRRVEGTSSNLSYPNNNRYVVTVAALNHENKYADYSSSGGNILISGYGGDNSVYIVTTTIEGRGVDGIWEEDIEKNYTNTMTGTSAAAPTVSGVLALVLEACPDLTWRDVKHLVAKHGTQVDTSHSGWHQNSAGLWHSSDYGYGLINGEGMINDCTQESFTLLGVEKNTTVEANGNVAIADSSYTTIGGLNIDEDMTIEWVELTVTANHENASDYKVELISPSGTVSILLEPVGTVGGAWMQSGFRFAGAGFIDEQSKGEWKVKISDIDYEPNELSGTIQNLKLTIYGH